MTALELYEEPGKALNGYAKAHETEKERKMEKNCDFTNSVPFRLELIAAVCREAAESYRQGNKDEVEEALYYVEERVIGVWKLLRGDV